MKKYLLGVDIGTTGSKVVLIDEEGRVINNITNEYPINVPEPGWSEQNPCDWWKATIKSIRGVIQKSRIKPDSITGIGITGQMHGLVLLDKEKNVLRPCILWNDQRTVKECQYINRRIGMGKLIEIGGKPALTSFTAGKILWVKKNEPDIYKRIAHLLLPKDYVRYLLTGKMAIDVNDASGTCLFDVKKREWSEDIIGELKIDKAWLPEVYESSEICGSINDEVANLAGLKKGTPVVCGAGDQAAQAIGTGIYKSKGISVTIGTSGVVFVAIDDYKFDKTGRLHTYCHCIPGMWHIMGVMLSAGGSLKWFRDTFFKKEMEYAQKKNIDIYDIMSDEAAKIKPGSEGLIFLPYLSGERTPHPDPYARGVFFGLSLKHTRAHMTRAVIEGVTYGLRDGLELIKEMGIKFNRIRVSGGGAKSHLWRRIMADVFNIDIVTVNATQGAAYGAALIAGVETGIYKDVDSACRKTIKETGIKKPGKDIKIYQRYYEAYRLLYPALKEHFVSLNKISKGAYLEE